MLLFIAMGIMAAACSDDNNATVQNNPAAIVGKWKVESILIDNTNALDLNDCDTGTYKEFKEDGTLHEYYKCGNTTYEDVSDYTISGNNVTTTLHNPDDGEDPNLTFIVTDLSETSMTTKSTFNDDDGVSHQNRTTFIKIE